MKTIAEITSRVIKATDKTRRKAKTEVLAAERPIRTQAARAYAYEFEVFNFLILKKAALGIREVIQFTNLLVDGQIILEDGRRLVQAEWQYRQFLTRTEEARTIPSTAGL
jgi:hypothetical protein